MFGIDTGEKVPDEIVNNSYAAWDSYMAHIWYNLLYFVDLPQQGTVIEVAPGCSTKIPEALQKTGFRGTLYVVEPHTGLAGRIKASYSLYLPYAKIQVITDTFEKVLEKLPSSPDALLSSHPLDDMLLTASKTPLALNALFEWATNKVPCVKSIECEWKKISGDKTELDACLKKVFHIWSNAVSRLNPERVLLSQYASFTLESADLSDLNAYSKSILFDLAHKYSEACIDTRIIQQILGSAKNYRHEHIGCNVLDAKNWLVMYKRRELTLG